MELSNIHHSILFSLTLILALIPALGESELCCQNEDLISEFQSFKLETKFLLHSMNNIVQKLYHAPAITHNLHTLENGQNQCRWVEKKKFFVLSMSSEFMGTKMPNFSLLTKEWRSSFCIPRKPIILTELVFIHHLLNFM